MQFLSNIYSYNFEGLKNGVYEYRFISEGNKSITKIVSLRPTLENQNVFNLGFGNLESDGTSRIVNDASTENNNDHEKVLNTVFSCMLHFFNQCPTAKVIFFGNTEHKHQYYKRRISANLNDLQEDFYVLGYSIEYSIDTSEIEYQHIRKNGTVITRKIKSKNISTLVIKKVKNIEIYQIANSKSYDFMLFCLKTENNPQIH
jgi:hypothetical protein